jgi:hypothetical protein
MVAAGHMGAGEHRLTIRQAGVAVKSVRFVVDDAKPSVGVWTDGAYRPSAGQTITIGSGGNSPGRDIHFDFYAKAADGQYRYWSTVAARADDHGAALTVIPTRPQDARSFLVMQRGAADAPIAIDLFGRAVGSAEDRSTDHPRSLFQRHDAPPAGVARQVAFFQEGGPGSCTNPKAERPTVVLEREVPRDSFGGTSDPEHFELGDHLRMCAFNFARGKKARLTIRRSDGSRSVKAFPAELLDQDIGTSWLIMPDAPIGGYRVTIRQGAKAATTRFSVQVPTVPGYETTGSEDRDPVVVVVGLPPHQRFRMSLYREPTNFDIDPAIPSRLTAEFAASVVVRADQRGTAVRRLRTAPGDPKACFVVKISYGQHVLNDLDNTLSTVCVPHRMYREPTL